MIERRVKAAALRAERRAERARRGEPDREESPESRPITIDYDRIFWNKSPTYQDLAFKVLPCLPGFDEAVDMDDGGTGLERRRAIEMSPRSSNDDGATNRELVLRTNTRTRQNANLPKMRAGSSNSSFSH